MKTKSIGIIGLGLIGGSIAKAAKTKLKLDKIYAWDMKKSSIESAIDDGVICEELNENNIGKIDILFVCTPVSQIPSYIEKYRNLVNKNCIITDIGSTKNEIIKKIEKIDGDFCYIGSHPMTGSERSGYNASKAHLFENAYYIIVNTSKTNVNAINVMTEFAEGIGSLPIVMEPKEHDRVMATISHFPHIVAAGLVNLLDKSCDNSKSKLLAAGGFRDITRIASADSEMWKAICLSNSDEIISSLDKFVDILSDIKNEIKSKNDDRILSYFSDAKTVRDSMNSSIRGEHEPLFEIIVDIEDKPGILGQVSTVLGLSKINIRNMQIKNNREFENGVLTVTLGSKTDQEKAYNVLKQFDFGVECSK